MTILQKERKLNQRRICWKGVEPTMKFRGASSCPATAGRVSLTFSRRPAPKRRVLRPADDTNTTRLPGKVAWEMGRHPCDGLRGTLPTHGEPAKRIIYGVPLSLGLEAGFRQEDRLICPLFRCLTWGFRRPSTTPSVLYQLKKRQKEFVMISFAMRRVTMGSPGSSVQGICELLTIRACKAQVFGLLYCFGKSVSW